MVWPLVSRHYIRVYASRMKETANPDFYDADSATYDETRWKTSAGAFTNAIQQRIFAELTSDWRERNVLEVGPGTARFTVPLARSQNNITLVDVSKGMLASAVEKLEQAGLRSRVSDCIEASIYDLPIESAAFDHAVCLNVLSHLEDGARAVESLARVVKPGGTVVLNYPNLVSYYWPAARRINARSHAVGLEVFSRWARPEEVDSWIADAGLELVRRVGHVHVPRAIEKYRLLPIIRALDAVSRSAPLSRFAPVHFCLCKKA